MRGALLATTAALFLTACAPSFVPPKRPRLACLPVQPIPDPAHPLAGMVTLKGATFLMGARAERPEEGPSHRVTLAAFSIDRTDVTNAAYARFVAATGYRTLAERPPKPASLVFVGAKGAVDLNDPGRWWRLVKGADWRHPYGPESDIKGLDAFPVVHIAHEDALAYARWLGRDLPTEAEWEYAARGGLADARYSWGDGPVGGGGKPEANTWQGVFPVADRGADGFKAQVSPVGCFPANGFGLYDMGGNVWQWTRDMYMPGEVGAGWDGATAAAGPSYVLKGGSFLCSDDFCFRYRPAARTAGPADSGASHIGFRTVFRTRGRNSTP